MGFTKSKPRFTMSLDFVEPTLLLLLKIFKNTHYEKIIF